MNRLSITIITLACLIPAGLFAATKELAVPFAPQAPDGVWIEPWRNACEETSTALIELYYFGSHNRWADISDVKYRILELVRLENKVLGYNQDNTANDIAHMINLFLPWEAYVIPEPTLDQIKREIDQGQ